MRHLIDYSTVRSGADAWQALPHHHGVDGVLSARELTGLVDLARLVELLVVSDTILVGERKLDVTLPPEVARLTRHAPLVRDFGHLDGAGFEISGAHRMASAVADVERLLGLGIVDEFVREIEAEITHGDQSFVRFVAARLGSQYGLPSPAEDGGSRHVFWTLVARTMQYMLTADQLGTPYACHAYRSPVVRSLRPSSAPVPYDIYAECESAFRRWLSDTVGADRVEFALPTYFLATMRDADDAGSLFKVAWQLRESKEASAIRKLLASMFDESGKLRLQRFAELRDLAAEQTANYQRSFGGHVTKGPDISATMEVWFSPLGVGAKFGGDVLHLSKVAQKWLSQFGARRSVSVVHKVGSSVYELLSLDHDMKRVFGFRLSPSDKRTLSQLAHAADSGGALSN